MSKLHSYQTVSFGPVILAASVSYLLYVHNYTWMGNDMIFIGCEKWLTFIIVKHFRRVNTKCVEIVVRYTTAEWGTSYTKLKTASK